MRKPLTKGQARTRAKAIVANWLEGFCELPDPDMEFSEADETLIGYAVLKIRDDMERGAHKAFLERLRSDGGE